MSKLVVDAEIALNCYICSRSQLSGAECHAFESCLANKIKVSGGMVCLLTPAQERAGELAEENERLTIELDIALRNCGIFANHIGIEESIKVLSAALPTPQKEGEK